MEVEFGKRLCPFPEKNQNFHLNDVFWFIFSCIIRTFEFQTVKSHLKVYSNFRKSTVHFGISVGKRPTVCPTDHYCPRELTGFV